MKTVGIALGGGGAKGLAHIAVLEVLDDLGIRPNRISGTSIGAIMGALYASGIPAKEMREGIGQLTASPKSFKDLVAAKQLPGWMEFIGVELVRESLLQVDRFLSVPGDFPLHRLGAGDFWIVPKKNGEVILATYGAKDFVDRADFNASEQTKLAALEGVAGVLPVLEEVTIVEHGGDLLAMAPTPPYQKPVKRPEKALMNAYAAHPE
jgi:hypothetical protein